jgi:hypothetical protein
MAKEWVDGGSKMKHRFNNSFHMIELDRMTGRQAEEKFKQEMIWTFNPNVGKDEEYDDFNKATIKTKSHVIII